MGVAIPSDYTVRRMRWHMYEPSHILRYTGDYEVAHAAWLRDEPYPEVARALAAERNERDMALAKLSVANEFADFDLTG